MGAQAAGERVELTCEIADARCGSVQLATARRTVSLR